MNFGVELSAYTMYYMVYSMGGNWATSRNFCKKISARKNVLYNNTEYL